MCTLYGISVRGGGVSRGGERDRRGQLGLHVLKHYKSIVDRLADLIVSLKVRS